jgi:hypothetical protein
MVNPLSSTTNTYPVCPSLIARTCWASVTSDVPACNTPTIRSFSSLIGIATIIAGMLFVG